MAAAARPPYADAARPVVGVDPTEAQCGLPRDAAASAAAGPPGATPQRLPPTSTSTSTSSGSPASAAASPIRATPSASSTHTATRHTLRQRGEPPGLPARRDLVRDQHVADPRLDEPSASDLLAAEADGAVLDLRSPISGHLCALRCGRTRTPAAARRAADRSSCARRGRGRARGPACRWRGTGSPDAGGKDAGGKGGRSGGAGQERGSPAFCTAARPRVERTGPGRPPPSVPAGGPRRRRAARRRPGAASSWTASTLPGSRRRRLRRSSRTRRPRSPPRSGTRSRCCRRELAPLQRQALAVGVLVHQQRGRLFVAGDQPPADQLVAEARQVGACAGWPSRRVSHVTSPWASLPGTSTGRRASAAYSACANAACRANVVGVPARSAARRARTSRPRGRAPASPRPRTPAAAAQARRRSAARAGRRGQRRRNRLGEPGSNPSRSAAFCVR